MDDLKIIKSLDDLGLMIDRISKTGGNKIKKPESWNFRSFNDREHANKESSIQSRKRFCKSRNKV